MQENSLEPTSDLINSSEYFADLIQCFPHLESEILGEHENLHFKMECFASYTVKQFQLMNWGNLRSCFEFQEQRMDRLNDYMRRVLDVSYFEALLLGEAWRDIDTATRFMGPHVLRGYTEYKNWYENLGKK